MLTTLKDVAGIIKGKGSKREKLGLSLMAVGRWLAGY